MYEELITELREEAEWAKANEWETPIMLSDHLTQAADAIEDLEKRVNESIPKSDVEILIAEVAKSRWTPIESRPMTEEERKEFSAFLAMDLTDDEAIIYTSDLPNDGDEILVCNKWGRVYEDTFTRDDDYGCGLEENGDLDGIVAWMPKPAPYKPEPPKEET